MGRAGVESLIIATRRPGVGAASFILGVSLAGCAQLGPVPAGSSSNGSPSEHIRVLDVFPGVTATVVSPVSLDPRKRVELILYALPNGNTTAQTIGRRMADGVDWHYDIQHIGAQTRALRARGMRQAVVVYLEADKRSWPAWRSTLGYDRANPRIVAIVDELRSAIGNPQNLSVTLTGHSGGGSFAWGFIDGQEVLPDWLDRIAFLDSNYSFETRHGVKITEWLRRDRDHTLVILAYDDREITLDGKKVVSDSGGTWRASLRMIENLQQTFPLERDTVGDFVRHHSDQIEILLHPNPANRILHTELVGEMNGYMHALLVRRPGYGRTPDVLTTRRAYSEWVAADVVLPLPSPGGIPPRKGNAMSGSAFIASIADLPRVDREAAIMRELRAGNVPSFLRGLSRIEITAADSAGVTRTIQYDVMPDYLSIGSDKDFVRVPMTPYTAQAFCDMFGFVLPTRKMVSDIWTKSEVKVDPRPLTEQRESPLTFLEHHRIIERQIKGSARGALVAGVKKDIVVTPRLDKPDRVAIFGWHRLNGEPIQPLYTGHVDWYVDYSHGIRPVRRSMIVDGAVRTFENILADPNLRYLISDEEGQPRSRYERP